MVLRRKLGVGTKSSGVLPSASLRSASENFKFALTTVTAPGSPRKVSLWEGAQQNQNNDVN